MQLNLVPHPNTPPSEPEFKIWANVDHAGALGVVASTNIWFGIGAPAKRFVIAEPVESERADELWKTTCFEAFLKNPGSEGYREWNFSPSGEWAAYDFTTLRDGRSDADVAAPYIRVEDNLTWWAMGVTIAVDAELDWALGLTAVLEEKDGTKSYWALVHPLADKPDFHDPSGFKAHLF